MKYTFRRFYEGLLAMAREGVPAIVIAEKIRLAIREPESRRQLLGHLRDSRDALEAEGKEEAAATLGRVIELLKTPEDRRE